MNLGEILTERTHKTPGKTLAGDDRYAVARPLPGPQQGPCRGHPRGHDQARTRQVSTVVPMQLPAHQLGRHLRGSMRPLRRLSKHLHGGMQIFVKTLPPCHLSSLPTYVALHASLARTRVEARSNDDGWEGPCYRPQ